MATIANIQILMTARAAQFGSSVDQSAKKLRAFINTADAMKEAKVNFRASLDQVRAGVIQAKRLARNLSETPVAIKIDAKIDQAKAKLMELKKSELAFKLTLAGEHVIDNVALKAIGLRKTFEGVSSRTSAAWNIATIRMGRAFAPVQTRAAAAAGFVQKQFGRLGLGGVMPVSLGDVGKSLGSFAALAKSGIRIPLTLGVQGLIGGASIARSALSGISSVASSVASTTRSAVSGLSSIAGAAAAVALPAAAGFLGIGTYAVKLAADAEQARVAFTTMLGSADKAKKLLGDINQFAAVTPFQTPELIQASKTLLAFGISVDQVIPTLRSLGDIAASGGPTGKPIGELASVFGKVRASGRLMTEELNQFVDGGVPLIAALAKQFKVPENAIYDLAEAGKIGFPQLQQALVDLTATGSMFGGGMAKQSQTVAGLFSTLQDTVTMSLTQIGTSMVEKLNLRDSITGTTNAIDALAQTALPVLDRLFGGLAGGGNVAQMVGNQVLNAAEFIATGFAYGYDAVKLIGVAFKFLQAEAALAIGGILKGIDLLGGGLVYLLNKLPGVKIEWTNTFGAMGDAVLDESKKLAQAGVAQFNNFTDNSPVKKVGQFFDQVRARANATASATGGIGDAMTKMTMNVDKTTQSLGKQVDVVKTLADSADDLKRLQMGMTDKEFDLFKGGATDTQLNQFRQLEQTAKDFEEAGKLKADFKSDAEKYSDRLAEISRARQADPRLTDAEINRAVEKAKKDFNVDQDKPLQKQAAAAERRSSEGLVNVDKPMQDLAKKQLDEQKKQTGSLTQISDSLTRNKVAVVSIENT